MSEERRYSEDEIERIFAEAVTDSHSSELTSGSAKGLTLAELQAIGREVGVSPERIAAAAAGLAASGVAPRHHTHLGMPVSADHVIDLPRAPTDNEWERVVADLRSTFRARGRDESHRTTRHWWNGNLHAYVEPTERGHRLRVGTVKGDAAGFNVAGVITLGAGVSLATVFAVSGEPLQDFIGAAIFMVGGSVTLAFNALRLPRWARLRQRQMQEIATRTEALLGSDGAGPGSGADPDPDRLSSSPIVP